MKRSDITDKTVCEAYRDKRHQFADELLVARTGAPLKVVYSAMERACDRGYLDYGVSLRSGWLTDKGKSLLGDQAAPEPTWQQNCDAVLEQMQQQASMVRVLRWIIHSDGMERLREISTEREVTEVDVVIHGGYPVWDWEPAETANRGV